MKSHNVNSSGLRIDLYLFDLIPDLTRSKIQSLIKSEQILVNKKPTKSSYILKIGKETFYKQLNMSLEDAYEYAAERMIQNLQADDAKEGIDAFLNKRDPEWSNS